MYKCGGSQRTQDFAKKPLNSFTIQSRVKLQRGRTSVLIRKSRENRGLFDSEKMDRRPRLCNRHGPRSHDPVNIARSIFLERS